MKEFVKVWQDNEGKVQIEIDESAPWPDIAIRMLSLFAEENDQRALNAHVTVTGFLLGLERTGDFQKTYLADVQRVAELVRDLAIKQRELDKKAIYIADLRPDEYENKNTETVPASAAVEEEDYLPF